jgi:formate hydrogenlyase transcriptional activator
LEWIRLKNGTTYKILLPADERDAMHLALRSIVEGTATATGTEFFRALVRELARGLSVRHAFVSELLPSGTRVRTLAFWFNDKPADNIEFDLEHTPCEIVMRGETVYYTHKVWEAFPHHLRLKDLGIESYFGVPLVSESGREMMGHLAYIARSADGQGISGHGAAAIFAAAPGAELERKRAEQALRKSEERLSSMLASAMDAIITLDAEQRITLFNPAAEKIFRCMAAQVIGQSFEPFLSKRLAICSRAIAWQSSPPRSIPGNCGRRKA